MSVLFFLGLVLVGAAFAYFSRDQFFPQAIAPEETEWPEGLKLISRSEWSNVAVANPDEISLMNGVDRITIHHDGMPPAPILTETQIKRRAVAIRQSHSTKYADIGYHYIIDPLGRVWEGRPIKYQGAHVKGENDNNIGVLFLGNTHEGKPSEAGLNGLYTFVRYLRQRHLVSKGNIYTHGELGRTECPGQYLQKEIDLARKDGSFEIPDVEKRFQFDWRKTVREGKFFLRKVKRKGESYIEILRPLDPNRSTDSQPHGP